MANIRGISEVVQAVNFNDEIDGLDLVGPIEGQAFETKLGTSRLAESEISWRLLAF